MRTDGTHVVAGERAIAELLAFAPARVRRLVVAAARLAHEVVARARALGIGVERAEPAALQRLADDGPAKGMVALAEPPPLLELGALLQRAAADPWARLVALDGVVDPHNKGAILRSAEFFGAARRCGRDRSAPVTAAVVRASAGASEQLPLCEVGNFARALRDCQDAGPWIVGTVADGGQPLGELARPGVLPQQLVVVLGSEHEGIRRLTREHCDFLVTIERRGAIASLNVSAAAAVVLAALRAPS
ncbi:MAG: RNA methyltransferase [Nannocystaceae bacterium]